MVPLWARVDLGTMAMKGCSALPKASVSLEPHDQIASCHIQDTLQWWWGGLTPLQWCSQCILQPQPTRQKIYTEKDIESETHVEDKYTK